MNKSEFDSFADEYLELHEQNIRLSGESPDYFAAYKIKETVKALCRLSVDPRTISTVIDFGSGIGNSLPHLASEFPGSRLFAVDVSERSLAIGQRRFPSLATPVQIDDKLPIVAADLAFSACVLHHIDHGVHGHWLQQVRQALRPGGFFVVFEHNPWNPLTQRAVNTCPFDKNAHLISMPALKRAMMAAGFRVRQARYTVFFPAMLSRLRAFEDKLAWLPLGGQYFVLAQK